MTMIFKNTTKIVTSELHFRRGEGEVRKWMPDAHATQPII